MPWNPDQFNKFQQERSASFDDLVNMLNIREGLRVIDLGCGTGELTARLADMLPNSAVIGIDTSAEMLAQAQHYVRPGLRFEYGDLTTIKGQWDVVFSHGVIQWVSDHPHLLPHLFSLVTPGGQLLVQVPSNHYHPSHMLVRQLAGEEPFKTALNGWVRDMPVLTIDAYANLLFAQGGLNLNVFEKIYPHVLAGADAIVEWTSGTLLVPYFERLGSLRDTFVTVYRDRLRERFPNHPVFYGFRRILFSAIRPSRN
ncbi:MAG: methyltransferase domain-containing protein [Anaerolineae bacterium]|nr:methyltransferase domain-containing protein [Anaerolineae bacterium]